MKTPRALYVLTVALGLAGASSGMVLGCGPGGTVAKVQSGPMPEGQVWLGVYFNPAFGMLHMEEAGDNIRGRWKKGEKFGEMSGTKQGNVVHFSWKETSTVFVGANAMHEGKGYFVYMPPAEANGSPRLKGEWGYKNDETGGGTWDCVKQLGQTPDVDSIKAETPNAIPATKDTWDSNKP